MDHPKALPDRILRLLGAGILDTPPEVVDETIVNLAGQVCGVPIAAVSLVEGDRQWFKASVGLDVVSRTPRDSASARTRFSNPRT